MPPTAARQLDGFLKKFDPAVAADARTALEIMRQRLPGALELVYDNYNALAIGFGPTERASDGIFSIAVFPRWVSLFFLQVFAIPLTDADRALLKGTGKTTRHIVLSPPALLNTRPVRSLMTRALTHAAHPLDPHQPHRIVIKSISAKQRPRR